MYSDQTKTQMFIYAIINIKLQHFKWIFECKVFSVLLNLISQEIYLRKKYVTLLLYYQLVI